jgi:hypothetical protein
MLTPSGPNPLQLSANPIAESSSVKTVPIEDLSSPTVYIRPNKSHQRELRELRAKQKAGDAIAGLTMENEIYGFTKGQFSLLQLLESVVEITGPVSFSLSTWTAARHEIQALQKLFEQGLLLDTRWLVDFSFVRRDPEAANQIRLAFGVDAIRIAQTHAKFALFANNRWKLVLRTSMNLNMNPRFEDFTLSHDPELYAFIDTILREIWTRQKRELADGPTREARRFWVDHM